MSAFTLSWPQENVAVLTFDLPGKRANILTRDVLAEFAGLLDELENLVATGKPLAGLVLISGKPGTFIAGADIREFATSFEAPKSETIEFSRRGQQLFSRLSRLPCPTVAAIDGACVGGGAELASWCDRRIFSSNPKTEFGFPEVKLGLVPGWGGTVRAPRIVGLANAVQMICGGESIGSAAAMQMGWASDVAPAEQLLAAALRIINEENHTKSYERDRQGRGGRLKVDPVEVAFLASTAKAKIEEETKGHLPAPIIALETMLESHVMSAEEALVLEAERITQLFGTPENVALVNVFFLTDYAKRAGTVTSAPTKEVKTLGVIGAGIMGTGIAAAAVKSGFSTTLLDASPAALEKSSRSVIEEVSYDKQAKKPNAERALKFAPLLHAGSHDDDLADADFVIEAVNENSQLKREVLSRIEAQLAPDSILTSNTSSIPISKLATSLKNPERFCGTHFFNPVRRMKLVEVVRGEQTSEATIAAAVTCMKRLGKMPIVVGDGPGFVVNRMLSAYLNEALDLLTEGVSIRDIDQAAVAFGMPLGPLGIYDLVGIDTAINVGKTMYEFFPDRVRTSPIIIAIYKAGRLGMKTGAGFYSYQNKQGLPQADPAVEEILNRFVSEKKQYSSEQIIHRLLLTQLLEAVRVLDEGIARDPRDIDLGMIYGLGWPAFRGGLLFWADQIGLANILKMLEPWQYLGSRMQAPESLVERAQRGERFYGK